MGVAVVKVESPRQLLCRWMRVVIEVVDVKVAVEKEAVGYKRKNIDGVVVEGL